MSEWLAKWLAVTALTVTMAWGLPAAAAGAETVTPAGMPALGKWLLQADGAPANWLGQPYDGKEMREPINIIIIDRASTTAEEATARLTAACERAGYPSRTGHSGRYRAYVGDGLYRQLPAAAFHAFANAFFGFDNNHGRIFGPYRAADGFYFTGAFSREVIDIFARVKHRYGSFTTARDNFAGRLAQAGGYRSAGKAAMENALPAEDGVTTGDHDGLARVLECGP